MAEGNSIYADVSTFPRASATPYDPLGTIGKLQGIEQQRIGIDQSKLKLINEKWDYSSKVLGTLLNKPDLTGDDVIKAHKQLLEQGVQTPEQFAQEVSQIPTLEGVKRQYPNANPQQQQQILSQKYKDLTSSHLMRGATVVENLNHAYGTNAGTMDVGGGFQPFNVYRGQINPTGPVTPYGLPRTTPGVVFDTKGNPVREAPIGTGQPNSPGLPIGGPMANPTAPMVPTRIPTTQAPSLPSNLGPEVNPRRNAAGQRNNLTGPETPMAGGVPFGQKEATTITGAESGKLLAQHRTEAANFQRTIFPLEKSIDSLEKLGTKGTGPGTDTWNNVKSFILSNVPGISEKTFDDTVKNYDEAKKYLTDFVNQNGNTGTNDKLAAAFAGNPSVHISNAAATDVAKAAMALARMKSAQVIAFGRTGLPDSAYGKWASDNAAQWDPRAFGVDKMTKDAKAKLYKELDKDPVAGALFDQSLEIAHNLGLVKLR